MRGGARRGTAVVLVIALALFAFGLGFLPSGREGDRSSVFSTAKDGRRAVLLLLQALGVPARAWTSAPGKLPTGEGILFVAQRPEDPPGYADGEDESELRARRETSRRLRDPLHYLRFVEEGGKLVTHMGRKNPELLSEALGLAELQDVRLEGERSDAQRIDAVFAGGERFRVSGWGGLHFAEPSLDSRVEVVVADGNERPVVLRLPVGRGAIYLLPDDTVLDNGTIGNDDHAPFLVRLLEEIGLEGQVLFDEYALGGWVPESAAQLALAPGNVLFTLHLFVLLGLALWSAAWVRGFARDPEPLGNVSPLARARAQAGLIEQAGRWSLAARMLRRGVIRRLAQKNGIRMEWDETRAQEGGLPREERQARTLEAFCGRLGPADRERARAALRDAPVAGFEELEELARELSWLEGRTHVVPAQQGAAWQEVGA